MGVADVVAVVDVVDVGAVINAADDVDVAHGAEQ